MSEIKKGTHGVLTNSNSGVTIPGTVYTSTAFGLHLYIDGVDRDSASHNYFPYDVGWKFEPDITLPTEIGSVIQITHWASNWDLSGSPEWRALLTGAGWRIAIDSSIAYSHDNLVKLFTEQQNIYAFEVVL